MLLALLLVLLQDPPTYKIEPALAVESTTNGWGFRVTGKTDLPDGTTLRARVFATDAIDLPSGREVIEQELESRSWPVEVKDGAFDGMTFETGRRPFSIQYRVRVSYAGRDQDGPLARKIGAKDFDAFADLAFGDPKDLEKELKASAAAAYEDFVRVRELLMQLQTAFAKERAKRDAKAWADWNKAWHAKVTKLADANERRFDVWVVWIEKQARMRVGAHCDWLTRLGAMCQQFLDGDKDALEHVHQSFIQFMLSIEEAFDLPGLDIPFNTDVLSRELKGLAEAAAALRALPKESRAAKSGPLLAAARDALLQMSTRKVVPRRSYDLLATLAMSFEALAAAFDGRGDLEETTRAYEAALRALKAAAAVE